MKISVPDMRNNTLQPRFVNPEFGYTFRIKNTGLYCGYFILDEHVTKNDLEDWLEEIPEQCIPEYDGKLMEQTELVDAIVNEIVATIDQNERYERTDLITDSLKDLITSRVDSARESRQLPELKEPEIKKEDPIDFDPERPGRG